MSEFQSTYLSTNYSTIDYWRFPLENRITNLIIPADHLYLDKAQIILQVEDPSLQRLDSDEICTTGSNQLLVHYLIQMQVT